MGTFTFTDAERRIFERREVLDGDVWASKHLIVQDGLYAGSPLRLDVSPFLAGPLKAFTTSGIVEVIICGSLQVGKTLVLYTCLGWCMDYRPGVKMLTMPTKSSMENVVERKLRPLIKGSPVLRRLVSKFRKVNITLKDGTAIMLASAESPGDRASITVQDLIIDEEDLYSSIGQSSALEDFKGRTRSYEDYAKIVRACQIKGGEESSIWRGITKEAEILFCYEVVCPACWQKYIPDVDNIVIPSGESDPKTISSRKLARYRCACGYHWSDHIRNVAVAKGGWHPYRYSDGTFVRLDSPSLTELLLLWKYGKATPPKSIGFHIPAFLSRMVSVSDIACRQMLAESTDNPAVKRQFYNDDLALPFSPVELQTTEQRILELREQWLPPQAVPNGAVALTCGIDVQKRGFWYLVKAWMPNLSSYIIDYGFLEHWDQVLNLCFGTYYPVLVPSGMPTWNPEITTIPPEYLTGEVMPIWRAPMDTGGTETDGVLTRTEEAYMWIRSNGQGVVHACKGASHVQTSVVRRIIRERMPGTGRPIPGGLPLHMIDTNTIKTIAMSRLINPESAQPCRLHGGCREDLAVQLASEQQIRKNGKLVWEHKSGQNHLFDCLQLADAAADASWTPSLPMYVLQLQQAIKAENMQKTTPKRTLRPKSQGHRG